MQISEHLKEMRALVLEWGSTSLHSTRQTLEDRLKTEQDRLLTTVKTTLPPAPEPLERSALPPIPPGTLMWPYAQLLGSQWIYGGHLWRWDLTDEDDVRRVTLETPQGRVALNCPTLSPTFEATIYAHWPSLLPTLTPPGELWIYGQPNPKSSPALLTCLGRAGETRTLMKQALWQQRYPFPLLKLHRGQFVAHN